MSREISKAKPLLRKKGGTRAPRTEFILVTEGSVTEPYYFNQLQNLWRYSLLNIRVVPGAGVPTSVVERAIEEFESKKRAARKNRDSFEIFEVWAIFDRDSFPPEMIQDAFEQAKSNGIFVAHSNPCFELWGLMHFESYARPGHHHETHQALRQHIDTYHHTNNPIFCPKTLKDRYLNAVKNSDKALKDRIAEGSPHPKGDPSTTVHLLTERIRKAANITLP